MNHTITLPELPPLAAYMQRFKDVDPTLVHMNEADAAACLGQAPKTLESWRRQGKELPFIKLGRRVQYRLSDVLECLERNIYSSSREARTRNRNIQQRQS